MTFKLKPKNHYLKVYISAPYQQTGEVWINTLKIPIYTNTFSKFTPLTEIIEWANNKLSTYE